MAYTVVGDSVNLAARLQELTRIYDTKIILGEETKMAVPDLLYCELDRVQVKGKNVPTRIYEPLGNTADIGSGQVDRVQRHEDALGLYYQRDWDQAEALFASLRDKHPERKLYAMYLDRIGELRENPPPESWEGEIRFVPKYFTAG